MAALALFSFGCATARLAPSNDAQKVPNRPKAAAEETKEGVLIQAEADVWSASERVQEEVTAMKVTIVNRGSSNIKVDYNAFELKSGDGTEYKPVDPDDISIRGASRSIGLPADTIITRSSDSSINSPSRDISEKEQIRMQLKDEALQPVVLPPGERTIGYIYFERVPTTKRSVTFMGHVVSEETGEKLGEVNLPFRVKEDYE